MKRVLKIGTLVIMVLFSTTISFSQTSFDSLNELLEILKNNTLSTDFVSSLKYQYPEHIVYMEYKYNPIDNARRNEKIMKESKLSITMIRPNSQYKKNVY